MAINPFSNIISSEMKILFNNAIDSLLEANSLSIPCRLKFGSNGSNMCPNCLYDPITKRSANKYNGTGLVSFYEGQICPVCQGFGLIETDSSQVLHLGIIFDSKYFLKWGSDVVNIGNTMVQSVCATSYLGKLTNAIELTVLTSDGEYSYTRVGSPRLLGFGDTNYAVTMWQEK